jgi:large subunit ribosomal protein L25
VALPAHETTLIARRANALLDLKMPEGQQLVLIKDIQRDPVRQIIEHLDLVIIRKGEKVSVDVAVHVEGESFSGTIVQLENNTINVEAEATSIPEYVSVSVEGLEEGSQIHASELVLPEGSVLLSDPELLILSIREPAKIEEPEPVAEGEGAAASGAGEADQTEGATEESSGDSDAGGE